MGDGFSLIRASIKLYSKLNSPRQSQTFHQNIGDRSAREDTFFENLLSREKIVPSLRKTLRYYYTLPFVKKK